MKKFIIFFTSICFLLLFFFQIFLKKNKQAYILKDKELLGQYLFFDNRLSLNNTKSCGSCHSPQFAFSDGYRRSGTALGENTLHNAPSLINAKFLQFYDWANTDATSVEIQMKRPLYNNHPIELGFQNKFSTIAAELQQDSIYLKLFSKIYPTQTKKITPGQIEECIAAYVKSLTSFQSNFDKNNMDSSAANGFRLFTSNTLKCSQCHVPPYFTKAAVSNTVTDVYFNIGLYNLNNKNIYPTNDNGLFAITKKNEDDGKFKIPSLRNVLLTAPYMHDGSVSTLDEVIEIYKRGGRNINYGNNIGDGALNKNKSKLITGFSITDKEKKDLINFLSALTDSSVFLNSKFQNPNRVNL